jgi:hypothetical protein
MANTGREVIESVANVEADSRRRSLKFRLNSGTENHE